jgi:hypothetical protein
MPRLSGTDLHLYLQDFESGYRDRDSGITRVFEPQN